MSVGVAEWIEGVVSSCIDDSFDKAVEVHGV